jgi:hypothetical protein
MHAAYDIETGLKEKLDVVQFDVHQHVEVVEVTATTVVRRTIVIPRHSSEEDQHGSFMYDVPRRRRNRGFYRSHYGFNRGAFGSAYKYGSFDRMVWAQQDLRSRKQRRDQYFWG